MLAGEKNASCFIENRSAVRFPVQVNRGTFQWSTKPCKSLCSLTAGCPPASLYESGAAPGMRAKECTQSNCAQSLLQPSVVLLWPLLLHQMPFPGCFHDRLPLWLQLGQSWVTLGNGPQRYSHSCSPIKPFHEHIVMASSGFLHLVFPFVMMIRALDFRTGPALFEPFPLRKTTA